MKYPAFTDFLKKEYLILETVKHIIDPNYTPLLEDVNGSIESIIRNFNLIVEGRKKKSTKKDEDDDQDYEDQDQEDQDQNYDDEDELSKEEQKKFEKEVIKPAMKEADSETSDRTEEKKKENELVLQCQKEMKDDGDWETTLNELYKMKEAYISKIAWKTVEKMKIFRGKLPFYADDPEIIKNNLKILYKNLIPRYKASAGDFHTLFVSHAGGIAQNTLDSRRFTKSVDADYSTDATYRPNNKGKNDSDLTYGDMEAFNKEGEEDPNYEDTNSMNAQQKEDSGTKDDLIDLLYGMMQGDKFTDNGKAALMGRFPRGKDGKEKDLADIAREVGVSKAGIGKAFSSSLVKLHNMIVDLIAKNPEWEERVKSAYPYFDNTEWDLEDEGVKQIVRSAVLGKSKKERPSRKAAE